jgi:hypothetical protein
MNMRLRELLSYRRLVVLLATLSLAVLVWAAASKPVLLHTHIWANIDDQLCGTYNEEGTGVTILNPFRSRFPEQTAEVFLRALSKTKCSPGLSERLCSFVMKHPLPAPEWRLVNRWEWDSAKHIRLFYRLGGKSQELAKHNGCAIAHVDLERTGGNWNISGYGVTPGPYSEK